MLVKLRDNLYLGDEKAFKKLDELKELGITALLVVADEMNAPEGAPSGIKVFKVGLINGANYGYVKDLACHIPKYLTQSGETILIQGKTGLTRGAFVAARAICELENRSVYEIFQEIKEQVPELNLSKVYL